MRKYLVVAAIAPLLGLPFEEAGAEASAKDAYVRFEGFQEKIDPAGDSGWRGHMTKGRAALCTWINETVNGKPWKRTLAIPDHRSVAGSVKDGKQYAYGDLRLRYVFPHMVATMGNVMEEVRIKPIRCELK